MNNHPLRILKVKTGNKKTDFDLPKPFPENHFFNAYNRTNAFGKIKLPYKYVI